MWHRARTLWAPRYGFAVPGIVAAQRGAAGSEAVTIDTVTAAGPFSADGWSFNHTTLGASANMAVLAVLIRKNAALTTLTFGGNAPAGFDEQLLDLATDIRVYWAWWLSANLPAAGSNVPVEITTSGTNRGFATMFSLAGAAQQTPEVIGGTATGATSVSAGSALTAAGGSFIGAAFFMNDGDQAFNATSGGSGAWTEHYGAGGADEPLNDDRGQVSSILNQSGAVTPSISWTSADDAAMNAIRVDPAA